MELLLVTNIALFKAHYNGTQRMNVVKRLLPRNMLDAAEGPVRAVDVDLRGPVRAMHPALSRDGLESPLTVIQHVNTKDR